MAQRLQSLNVAVVLVLFVVVLTQGQSGKKCQFGDSVLIDGTCFRYINASANWKTAKAYCESWGGALAKVNNKEQAFKAIKDGLHSKTWIGANDIDVEGTFVWDHDNSSVNLTWFWDKGRPNSSNPGNDCVIIFRSSLRYTTSKDVDCSKPFGSLCMERTFQDTSPSTTTPRMTTTEPTTGSSTTSKLIATTPATTTTTPATTTTTPATTTSTPATTTTTPATTTLSATDVLSTSTDQMITFDLKSILKTLYLRLLNRFLIGVYLKV